MVKNKTELKKIIIAAVSQNGIIGSDGKIPWKSKSELNHFKFTTLNSAIIFGRKTFESFDKPLNNRTNIIISKTLTSQKKDFLIFPTLGKAYNYLRKNKFEKVFICGGYKIYLSALRNADEMILSVMKFSVEGDTKFPKINFSNWNLIRLEKNNDFDVYYYERKKKQ
ncbi:MAG: dihydrofolate reductase [Ignavibacteriae bacterium]|nr:dihydrofolate reductase [Ignavibacteriota bacterium]